jgi:hypothetical protein
MGLTLIAILATSSSGLVGSSLSPEILINFSTPVPPGRYTLTTHLELDIGGEYMTNYNVIIKAYRELWFEIQSHQLPAAKMHVIRQHLVNSFVLFLLLALFVALFVCRGLRCSGSRSIWKIDTRTPSDWRELLFHKVFDRNLRWCEEVDLKRFFLFPLSFRSGFRGFS